MGISLSPGLGSVCVPLPGVSRFYCFSISCTPTQRIFALHHCKRETLSSSLISRGAITHCHQVTGSPTLKAPADRQYPGAQHKPKLGARVEAPAPDPGPVSWTAGAAGRTGRPWLAWAEQLPGRLIGWRQASVFSDPGPAPHHASLGSSRVAICVVGGDMHRVVTEKGGLLCPSLQTGPERLACRNDT